MLLHCSQCHGRGSQLPAHSGQSGQHPHSRLLNVLRNFSTAWLRKQADSWQSGTALLPVQYHLWS